MQNVVFMFLERSILTNELPTSKRSLIKLNHVCLNLSYVGSCSDDARLVLRILENLVKVGRFDMTVLFLTAKDKTGHFLFLNVFLLLVV
jgi:hypothetical protein